jgi:TolB protein
VASIVLASSVLAGLVAGMQPPARAAFPGDNGLLAFTSNRDGNDEIYVVRPDGTGTARRTVNAATDREPSWSPSGDKIAFSSNRDGDFEIFVMDASGANVVQLTKNAAADMQPAWDPDGKRIAFVSDRDNNLELYVMNADGTGQTRLTTDSREDSHPSWSPKGDRIALQATRIIADIANTDIYTISPAGGPLTRITTASAEDTDPDWSPDAKQIVFMSRRVQNIQHVFTMNADGTSQIQREPFANDKCCPVWSPRGDRIAFAVFDGDVEFGGSFEVYTMNPDGSGLADVSNAPSVADTLPSWQPQHLALTTTKTAAIASVPVGGTDTYTIRITNPNSFAVSVQNIIDTLPATFTYVTGSSTGVTTANPAVTGSVLTWNGPFSVPGSSSVTQTFKVNVGACPGTHLNEATATPAGFVNTVTPSGPTAPVTVTAQALTTTKTADSPTAGVRTADGYTIRITNPNNGAATFTQFTDTLPSGFTYVAGSTSGATTADPSITGQTLTWTGSFTVPANGTLSLHFGVLVAASPGRYFNSAAAVSIGRACPFTFTPTGQTAPIDVTVADLVTTKTADSPFSTPGSQNGFTIKVANPNAVAASLANITDTLPAGFSYVGGSTTGATTADPSVSGRTLTWAGPFSEPPNGSVSLRFKVVVPSSPGVFTNTAAALADGFTVRPGSAVVTVAARIVTAKTADSPTSKIGTTNGYTITLSNPNPFAVQINSIQDTLPPDFTYVTGSSAGVTTADPVRSGQLLTWAGPFSVPARSSVSLHFSVRVSGVPGVYFNEAGGTAREAPVTATGRTARIVVSADPIVTTKTADAPESAPGGTNGYTITLSNPNAAAARIGAVTDLLPEGFAYQPGTTTGITTTDPSVSGRTLRWDGPFTVPAGGSVSLHFLVTVSTAPGRYLNEATGVSAIYPVAPTGPTALIVVKGPTRLVANPAVVEVLPGAVVYFPMLSATLTDGITGLPVAGKVIEFSVGSTLVCRGVTDQEGVGACGGLVEDILAVLNLGYEAAFSTDAEYTGSNDHGPLVDVMGVELP